ncbi:MULTISPECIES: phage tail tape measure protein [unclassified Pseudomonas]|uniref:phage tail tape measure protein n=1 Tax=unclassified Pseudomonas TaxID=196821 RepID=UPI002AC8E2FB|nr:MULTISPECIES: phage tail tape measure protein [unclassified Pseudomonas]MEB0045753.1 phage tail tape measure protein [Pseudomonas sp. Dout3]MEB0098144.1 phage tail tape measure protein [Pseudomonas sp. DC1.2]WPX60124.1 phage tail tape measure protein [Pseudomonas sp. DC1.2]
MADSKYSLAGAQINAFELPASGGFSATLDWAVFMDPLAQLSLALNTLSVDIRLLTVGQGKLGEVLASLTTALSSTRSLSKASAAAPAPAGEPKSLLKAEVGQRAPPEYLKSAMAMQSAMVDLNQKLQLKPNQLQAMFDENQKIAGEKPISPSGATGMQLAQVQLAAVNAGLVKGVKADDRPQVLTNFARDSAVMASAYKIDLKDAGVILAGWRTSLGLDREKSLDLGNAANRLGASVNLKSSAADISSVVLQGGETGLATGMKPEDVAAIAAALLSASVGKDEAGASLKNLGATLSKGDNATADQRAAWAQLDIEPGALASRMRTDAPGAINDVLAALKRQPVERQTLLLKTLFESDEGVGKLLKAPNDLKTAFVVASDKGDGSMAQTADARGNTSQARWNALDASVIRLQAAIVNAVTPFTDLAMLSADLVVSGLSSVVETFPKVTAALTVLGAALAKPFRGAILSKLASFVSSTSTELLKPDAAIQAPGGTDPGVPDAPGKQSGQGAGKRETPRPTVRSRLVSSAARAKSFTGRLGAPLALASAGYDGVKALMAGDYKAATGAVGSGVGGLAGGYAGAATGALIGSFVPVVGTAVGALIGGLVGSYFGSQGGESLGKSLYSEVDQLRSPDQVTKDLTRAQADNRQFTYSPSIQVSGADPTDADRLTEKIMANLRLQFSGEFMPLMMNNPLAVRSDAALTDGGT